MKLVRLIQEIGQADPKKAYPYELEDESGEYRDVSYKYSFETEETEDELPTRYVMWIEKRPYDNMNWDDEDPSTQELDYDVSFAVRLRNPVSVLAATSFDAEPNKGNMYRVMSTVVNILKDRMAQDRSNGQVPKTITFYPSKTKGENDERRAKLYAAYAKTQLPNSTIAQTRSGKGYIITLN